MTIEEKVKRLTDELRAFNDEHDQRQRPVNKERYHVKYESPFMYYLWMAQNK